MQQRAGKRGPQHDEENRAQQHGADDDGTCEHIRANEEDEHSEQRGDGQRLDDRHAALEPVARNLGGVAISDDEADDPDQTDDQRVRPLQRVGARPVQEGVREVARQRRDQKVADREDCSAFPDAERKTARRERRGDLESRNLFGLWSNL